MTERQRDLLALYITFIGGESQYGTKYLIKQYKEIRKNIALLCEEMADEDDKNVVQLDAKS